MESRYTLAPIPTFFYCVACQRLMIHVVVIMDHDGALWMKAGSVTSLPPSLSILLPMSKKASDDDQTETETQQPQSTCSGQEPRLDS